MALPLLKKTWQFAVNNHTPASGNVVTDYQNLMLAIKSLLVGTGTHPWTVLRSSTSLAVADADLWLASGDLVWAAGVVAHSWIVLKQTHILSNFQICIDLNPVGWGAPIQRGIVIGVSPAAGFTGGTTTARPTAADEIIIRDGTTSGSNSGYWFFPYIASFSFVTHAIVSNDGACTRIVMHGSGVSYGLWLFDALAEAPTEMTYPFIADVYADVGNNSRLRYADLNDVANSHGAHPGVGRLDFFLTSEGFNNSTVGELIVVANDLSAQWPIMGVGVASEQAGARGRIGGIYDLWWGSTGVGEGNTYPNDGSRAFAQFGHLVFPWSGVVPTISSPPGVDTQRPTYTIQPVLPPAPRIVPVEDD